MIMKKIYLLSVVLLLLMAGCSKEEEVKLSVSGTNAFAMNMGKGWEVQALTEVHGFKINEKDDMYSARIFFTVDIITASGQTLKSIFTKEVDKKEKETFKGINLEAQFNIGADYTAGKYKAVFNIKDMFSGKSTQDTTSLKLEN